MLMGQADALVQSEAETVVGILSEHALCVWAMKTN